MSGRWADRKGSAHSRGYGAAWRRVRKLALDRDGHCCVACAKRGRKAVPARCVDHIVPKEAGGSDELANLQSLCFSCHGEKTVNDSIRARGGKVRPRIGKDGWPEVPL